VTTNYADDTYLNVSADDLNPGDTIELDGRRYTVDHTDLTSATDDPEGVTVHTTSGVTFGYDFDDTVTVVIRHGIPAPATEPDRRVAGTVVHHWSGVTLPAAATLVRRADLRPGDIVQSSHGYRLHVTGATVQGATSDLRGTLRGPIHGPDGPEHVERHDASSVVPVYSRGPEPTPAPADTVTLTLTREQVQHLSALVDHADRWHSEWSGYIKDEALLNKDITEEWAQETQAEHDAASALGVELLRQANAATADRAATPTD